MKKRSPLPCVYRVFPIFKVLTGEDLRYLLTGNREASSWERIEVFIGHTVLEAAMKARMKFPDQVFYFIRVGYPTVHCLAGTGKRVSVSVRENRC